eukprot:jgi/Chrzof1/10338/Cz04g38120.t1
MPRLSVIPVCRRYFIGCDKLAALGWREATTWEEGLRKTIDWYLNTKCDVYWQGDLESALRPHPVLVGTALTSGLTSAASDATKIANGYALNGTANGVGNGIANGV